MSVDKRCACNGVIWSLFTDGIKNRVRLTLTLLHYFIKIGFHVDNGMPKSRLRNQMHSV